MRFKDIFNDDGVLGLIIDNKKVTIDTPNHKWVGLFDCINLEFKSLKYCPREIDGDFHCYNNKSLTSLKYCPSEVSGDFLIYNNRLTSLEGCPDKINGHFWCNHNNLTSLKGCPKKIMKSFFCTDNKLTSLEGAPPKVGGDFHCYSNKLTSLEGCPSEINGDFMCYNNNLTSLKDIHKMIKYMNGKIDCDDNPIKSHVLGLLLIPGLKEIRSSQNEKWIKILKNYVGKGKAGVLAAQAELIEAGLEEYARL